MTKEKIVVVGGGGHAKVIITILKKITTFEIAGYTDNVNKNKLLDVEYLGTDEILDKLFISGVSNAVIGIGQLKSSAIRINIIRKLKEIGFKFPPIVSTTAIINADVKIGDGTVIMDGVVINTGARIGKFSIINTKASIDHDCIIGDNTHIAPGVTLSGDVIIGNEVLIGTGASVIQGRKIVDHVIVAAGSSVMGYLLEKGTYIGIPARPMPTKEDFKSKNENKTETITATIVKSKYFNDFNF